MFLWIFFFFSFLLREKDHIVVWGWGDGGIWEELGEGKEQDQNGLYKKEIESEKKKKSQLVRLSWSAGSFRKRILMEVNSHPFPVTTG